ncbi:uncharacterized protein LOC124270614 isoform X9 [Haliotis rubra]|uniref:uncharacterized protein LOC124270614 isoform X9 n=1 Tax=Haliotis rubra TaxID=36100 RepID=UPI001EE5E73A|nr:uncharacterized protein LOC124270614 isoform X9 [Haliotis rubra]XP_046561608.1 uncharacterized protein LOC124270614 isoform X9 [Haliotis rubra]
MFQVDHIIYYYGTYCRQLIVNAMTYGRTLLFQLVLIRFLVCKEAPEISSSEFYTSGETCSFKKTAGQKGMDSLRINSGTMTADVEGCKTLCNTTELCIAGEFLSTTKTCHMYSLETSLTAQADIVFFQWDCTNETATTSATTTPATTTAATTTPATRTPASMSTITPSHSSGQQYNEVGAIASPAAGVAVLLLTIPMLVCMIIKKIKARGHSRH